MKLTYIPKIQNTVKFEQVTQTDCILLHHDNIMITVCASYFGIYWIHSSRQECELLDMVTTDYPLIQPLVNLIEEAEDIYKRVQKQELAIEVCGIRGQTNYLLDFVREDC
jgi:hypothetical protein